MPDGRAGVLDEIAGYLLGQARPHPLRVCIDGRTASGKTTFADALAYSAQAGDAQRQIIRTSIDGFHNPRSIRYARGRLSPEGYYHDARNLSAIIENLLVPLGPGGDGRYRTEVWDLAEDRPSAAPVRTAATDAILIVDGTFLNRPELASHWDVRVFLDVSETTAFRRGAGRDASDPDKRAEIETIYKQRYLPAFEIYHSEARPEHAADFIVSLEDFDRPFICRRLG